jgi:hypothetical protein
VEDRSGADQGDEVGALTALQRVWAESMSLKAMASPAALEPGPLVTLVRGRTVAKVDSMGLVSVVLRWIQRSAGKSKKASSSSGLSVMLATALGHLGPKASAKALMAASP